MRKKGDTSHTSLVNLMLQKSQKPSIIQRALLVWFRITRFINAEIAHKAATVNFSINRIYWSHSDPHDSLYSILPMVFHRFSKMNKFILIPNSTPFRADSAVHLQDIPGAHCVKCPLNIKGLRNTPKCFPKASEGDHAMLKVLAGLSEEQCKKISTSPEYNTSNPEWELRHRLAHLATQYYRCCVGCQAHLWYIHPTPAVSTTDLELHIDIHWTFIADDSITISHS